MQFSSIGSSKTIYLTPWTKNSTTDSNSVKDSQTEMREENEPDYSGLFESNQNQYHENEGRVLEI